MLSWKSWEQSAQNDKNHQHSQIQQKIPVKVQMKYNRHGTDNLRTISVEQC